MQTTFTDPARRALLAALHEAERFGQQYVGTEHLLIGMAAAGEGVAAVVLGGFGIDEARVRGEVAKLTPATTGGETLPRTAQTPRTRKVLARAAEEARLLDQDAIGTGHLLLGVVYEYECTAARLLARQFGLKHGEVQRAVCERLGQDTEGVGTGPAAAPARSAPAFYDGFTGQARRVVLLAHREAHRCGHDYVGTEHLLLGVLREGSGRVVALLQSFGVSAETARLELERSVLHGPEVTVGARLPLTPPARRALQFARDESRQLRHERVGPEHVLLGVLHEPEGEAARVLVGLGLGLDGLRAEIRKLPPSEDRDTMLQPAPAPGAALAQDPSAYELEALVAAEVSPAAPVAPEARLRTPVKLPRAAPAAAGLALQLRFTQLVLAGLSGVVVGAVLHGRLGGWVGLLVGLVVAAAGSTVAGVLIGMLAGVLVAGHHARHSPALQILALFAGVLVGCCFGDFVKGFARAPAPAGRGPPELDWDDEVQVDEDGRK